MSAATRVTIVPLSRDGASSGRVAAGRETPEDEQNSVREGLRIAYHNSVFGLAGFVLVEGPADRSSNRAVRVLLATRCAVVRARCVVVRAHAGELSELTGMREARRPRPHHPVGPQS